MNKEIPSGWNIEYNPKPVPPRLGIDYDFWHENFDGENGLCGVGSSVEDCIEQINEMDKD